MSAPFSNEICLPLKNRLIEARERSLSELNCINRNVLFDRYVLDIFHEFKLQPVVYQIVISRCISKDEDKIIKPDLEKEEVNTLCAPIEKPKYYEEDFTPDHSWDFRKTIWGMSKAQVRLAENRRPVSETNNELIYSAEIDGHVYDCFYAFSENKLYGGMYRLKGKYRNKDSYLITYKRLKEALINNYGKPNLNYEYFSSWETSSTQIQLSILESGSNFDLIILYKSNELNNINTSKNIEYPQEDTQKSDEAIEIIKKNARAEWGNDERMYKYEVEQQTSAYNWYKAENKYPEILKKAKDEWQYDYRMIKYEYEQQTAAYELIQRDSNYPNIMSRAKNEWGDDYRMVKYEYEQQVEAYEWLQKNKDKNPEAFREASNKWQDDYRMVKYEYEKFN